MSNEHVSKTPQRVERVIDAVLLAEAHGGPEHLHDAVRGAFAPASHEMGVAMGRCAARDLSGGLVSLVQVLQDVAGLAEDTLVAELAAACAMVQLLAQTLAAQTGVDTAHVLREVLDVVREVSA